MSIAAAHAAPMNWSNFYVSVFGGAAAGNGSVTAHGVDSDYDTECNVYSPSDPEYCIFDMNGTVGSGLFGGLAFGTTFGPSMRGEAELSFAHLGTTTSTNFWDPENSTNTPGTGSGSLDATFMFGNIWYDIPLGDQLSAYVGGGAGFAHATGTFPASFTGRIPSDLSLNVNGFAPAVQIGGGLTFTVAPKVTLDLGYRFKEAFGLPVTEASSYDTSLTSTHSTSMNLGVHVFQVGVNFALN